jgi:PAS domain S-box-containing protein
MDNINDLLAVINEKFEVEYINKDVHYELTGYTNEDLIGKNTLEFVHLDDVERAVQAYRNRYEIGEGQVELRYKTKDGKYKWLEVKGKRFKDLDGKDKSILISRDIDKYKNMEKILRESEEKYRNLVDNIHESIFELDENGIVIDTTHQIYNITGYKPEEIIGGNMREFIHPDDLELVSSTVNRVLKIGEVGSVDYRRKHKNGHYIYLTSSGRRVKRGDEYRIYGVTKDITGQKNAEEKLKESEKEKTIILESISELIVFQDINHQIIWTNKAASDSLNKSPEELIGQKCYELWNNSNEPCIDCPLTTILKTAKPAFLEKTTQDGRVWDIKGYPIIDETNKVIGFVEVTKEITEQRKTEQLLIDKERFLSNVFKSIQDGICIINEDYTILQANPTIENWYSYMRPIEGKKCYELYHQRTEPCLDCFCFDILETGESCLKVIPRKGKNGEKIGTLETYCSPFRDQATGKISGIIEYIRDITNQYKTEEKLKQSEEKSRGILENIREGYFEVDLQGNLSFYNEAFCKILGYSKKELAEMNINEIVDEKTNREVRQFFFDIYQTEIPQTGFQFEIGKRPNEKKYLETSCYLRYDT